MVGQSLRAAWVMSRSAFPGGVCFGCSQLTSTHLGCFFLDTVMTLHRPSLRHENMFQFWGEKLFLLFTQINCSSLLEEFILSLLRKCFFWVHKNQVNWIFWHFRKLHQYLKLSPKLSRYQMWFLCSNKQLKFKILISNFKTSGNQIWLPLDTG